MIKAMVGVMVNESMYIVQPTRNPSPAESTKTLVNEGSVPEINIVPGHHFASNLSDFTDR